MIILDCLKLHGLAMIVQLQAAPTTWHFPLSF